MITMATRNVYLKLAFCFSMNDKCPIRLREYVLRVTIMIVCWHERCWGSFGNTNETLANA